jgi:hypothetical protein
MMVRHADGKFSFFALLKCRKPPETSWSPSRVKEEIYQKLSFTIKTRIFIPSTLETATGPLERPIMIQMDSAGNCWMPSSTW